ncbi:MAG: MFS transporter [Acidobacteria bacterium]|nr:MFS transporter [Acidobacteriota bacterium]
MKAIANRSNTLRLVLAFAGFISIGLPDGLLGVAWPSMRAFFHLPLDALGSLLVSYTIGYLCSSFSSGRLLRRFSVGVLLALSCLVTGVSLIGYATTGLWWIVILLGSLAGLGAGAIDAGLNTFAATHFSHRTVNWLHAFYGVGAFSGPLLMTKVLDAGRPWQLGYAIVGGGQLALALCFGVTLRLWQSDQGDSANPEEITHAPTNTTLRLPVVWLSIAVFFAYTGIEAAAGAWAFTLFTEARGISMMLAGTWVSLYWGSLTAGRIGAALITNRISPHRLLRSCIVGQIIGAMLLWGDWSRLSSFLGLALIGLASAPIFPSLIATTPTRLGPQHTANAVGFQIAAAVLGQSLIPALIGFIAQAWGLTIIPTALLIFISLLLLLHEGLLAAVTQHQQTMRAIA